MAEERLPKTTLRTYNVPEVTKFQITADPHKAAQITTTFLPYTKSKREHFNDSMTELERKIGRERKITLPYYENKSIVRLFMEAMNSDSKKEWTFQGKVFSNAEKYGLALMTTHQAFFEKLYAKKDIPKTDCMPFLHAAAKNGYNDICTTLLGYGANPDDRPRKYFSQCTPLHLAARNGHVETVSIFLNKNAKLNLKNKNSTTPIHEAMKKLENAMDDNEKKLEDIYKKIISLLISAGADITIKDNSLHTPIETLRNLGGHAKEITHWFEEEVKKTKDVTSKKRSASLITREVPGFFEEQAKKKQHTTGSFHGLISVTGHVDDLLCKPESVVISSLQQ